MCYRPAATVTIVKCLECGAFNKPTNETCQKCGADLNESRKAANDAVAANAPAPKRVSLEPTGLGNAPSAPKAPGAPSAPGAPK